jgi:hypothetical protein
MIILYLLDGATTASRRYYVYCTVMGISLVYSSIYCDIEGRVPSYIECNAWGCWSAVTPLLNHAGGASELFTAAIQPKRGLKLEGIIFDKLSWVSSTILEHNLGTAPERLNEEDRVAGKSPVNCL